MGWLQKVRDAIVSTITGRKYAAVMSGRTPIY